MIDTPEPLFEKKSDVECNELPDGYVIYDRQRDKVHFLNFTAAALYELCDGTNTVSAMVEILREAFELPGSPRAEVEACLSELRSEELILQSNRVTAD